jgi:4-hydroxybenzoate polyprenyltransferase
MRAWLQLIRLPNLFTSAADVLAGFFFANASIKIAGYEAPLAFAIAASVCLYAAGVTLNDVFDAPKDALERPTRPRPSGRVKRQHAALVGIMLLLAGWLLAYGAGRPAGILATVLAVSILLYDGAFKATALGPVFMGLCRGLNVTLGFAAAGYTFDNKGGVTLGVVALLAWTVYTMALTGFARREAGRSHRATLVMATLGMLFGISFLATLPILQVHLDRTYFFGLALVALTILFPAARAIRTLSTGDVQRAVRTFVLALVLLGASLAWSRTGIVGAAIVAALVIPARLIARRVPVT